MAKKKNERAGSSSPPKPRPTKKPNEKPTTARAKKRLPVGQHEEE